VGAISQNNGLTSKPIFDGKNYTENQFNTGHNSAFAKPGFLSTFERFRFCVTFGFADAFLSKFPGFANAQNVIRNAHVFATAGSAF